ncbi:hypothetical protein HPB52_013308 [Rhipicephalus sanguineus]|uniref:Uncharacterized protein n=1 Tax=Rhipicephalus sanguineus TaxID=34632 RepID=A0A9D4PMR1_RHISA|nr:hypothetical protein HPB52_013308 [Rhipicephalus sanguineus]
MECDDVESLDSSYRPSTESLNSKSTTCSVVPARALRLPCGHAGCRTCVCNAVVRAASHRDPCETDPKACPDGLCPEEWSPLSVPDVKIVTSLELLRHQIVLCDNARLDYTFHAELRRGTASAELSHLAGHLRSGCHVSRKIRPRLRNLGRSGVWNTETLSDLYKRHARNAEEGVL